MWRYTNQGVPNRIKDYLILLYGFAHLDGYTNNIRANRQKADWNRSFKKAMCDMSSFTHINSIENLESRFLLTSFASLNANGVLSVVGDSQSNAINVVYNLNTVKVTRDGVSLSFDKANVKKIWAEGFGGNDKITIGVPLPSTLIGDSGNDTLIGNAKDDELHGGSGNDSLTGASGTNLLDPGGGNDVIDYSAQSPGGFGLGLSSFFSGLPQITHSVNGKVVSVDQFAQNDLQSRLTVLLTPGNDTFSDVEVTANWNINAGAGNDNLGFGFSVDGASLYSFNGGAGNDTMAWDIEDSSVSSVSGGSGNDVINEEDGEPSGPIACDGGSGYDTYNFSFDEAFSGGKHDVTVPQGIEAFNISSDGDLIVRGNDLNNDIAATASNVTVYGNGGDDRLNVNPSYPHGIGLADGGSGNDTLVGGGATVFKGGPGNDTADFSASTANLNVSLDNVANDGKAGQKANVLPDVENIWGGSGNDKLIGNPFNNVLKGGAGNDTLWGGVGNDTLTGGPGHDMLFGQDGNDTLLARDGQVDSLDGGAGIDKAQRDNTASINDQVLNIEAFI
jgi:Ca2+-binding RTX toxin-like protein